MKLLAVASLWLPLAGGLYLCVDPYLHSDLAKMVAMLVAMALAWVPIRPLYRRWS